MISNKVLNNFKPFSFKLCPLANWERYKGMKFNLVSILVIIELLVAIVRNFSVLFL